MKKLLLSFFLSVSIFTLYSKTWIVTNSGVHFTPDTLDIKLGDSVRFNITNTHNVLEVGKDAWEAEESTALAGGFSLPMSGGLLLPAQLTTGTHYYICTPHISLGMKGIIFVHPANGIAEQAITPMTLFPNPARENISVKIPAQLLGALYFIFDENGKQVAMGKLEKLETIVRIEHLSNGLYFFQSGLKREETCSFIKQ